jgi:hypothetical protein
MFSECRHVLRTDLFEDIEKKMCRGENVELILELIWNK